MSFPKSRDNEIARKIPNPLPSKQLPPQLLPHCRHLATDFTITTTDPYPHSNLLTSSTTAASPPNTPPSRVQCCCCPVSLPPLPSPPRSHHSYLQHYNCCQCHQHPYKPHLTTISTTTTAASSFVTGTIITVALIATITCTATTISITGWEFHGWMLGFSSAPVYLIQFTFRRLEIPPDYSANHLGCIGGCDETLRQLTEICGTGSRLSARGRGGPAMPNNVQRSNTRQGACIYCHQTGHSSGNCPSQSSGPRSSRPQSMNVQSAGQVSISCSACGAPCTLRTANTTTNRGRKFYSCQSQACNFFVWEDSINNGNRGRGFQRVNVSASASNPSRSQGHGRGGRGAVDAAGVTFVSATGDPISGRRCFVCGDPSHFANACPNRGI